MLLEILSPEDQVLKKIIDRNKQEQEATAEKVGQIIKQVKERGDEALCEYTYKFDRVQLNPEQLKVTTEEIKKAYTEIDDDFLAALRVAIDNITSYHKKQLKTSWFEPESGGALLGQLLRPLQRTGMYVPGGTAAYPSSVLMNALPAQVAGVDEVVMVTPPDSRGTINPHTLVAASEAGVSLIFKAGGAQAIAALASGTESIPKVDKITGPGNIFVTLAKQQVYGTVDIDMLAGPSEIMVIADEEADPRYVAADILSQAEHDVMASAVLLTPYRRLAEQVNKELAEQLDKLPRQGVARESLLNYGAIVVTEDIEQAVSIANEYAPEHLELMVREPYELLRQVKHAGAVFLGAYSPEPVGDYLAGPNHILPTGGTARFYSPLNVDSFMKKSSLISYSRETLERNAEFITCLSRVEGLEAHAKAVEIRMEDKKEGLSNGGV